MPDNTQVRWPCSCFTRWPWRELQTDPLRAAASRTWFKTGKYKMKLWNRSGMSIKYPGIISPQSLRPDGELACRRNSRRGLLSGSFDGRRELAAAVWFTDRPVLQLSIEPPNWRVFQGLPQFRYCSRALALKWS